MKMNCALVRAAFVVGALATAGVQAASGPNCSNSQLTAALNDPGVSAALRAAGKAPGAADTGNSGLCNPNRYRGGAGWSNQGEVNDLVKQSVLCNDPWIGEVYAEAALGYSKPNGSGASGECSPSNYGGGSWSGYNDLRAKVLAYKQQAQLRAQQQQAQQQQAQQQTQLLAQQRAQQQAQVKAQQPTQQQPPPAPVAPAPSGSNPFKQDSGIYIGGDPNYGRAVTSCATPAITAALASAGKQYAPGSGNTGACDPARYKGGQWKSQSELGQLVQQSFLCDRGTPEQPWIAEAYAELGYGAPRRKVTQGTSTIDECDPKLYSSSFGGYLDTKAKVEQYKAMEKERMASSYDPNAPLTPDDPANIGRIQETLPKIAEAAAAYTQAKTFTDNMGQVVNAMRTDGLFDPTVVSQLSGVLDAMRYLMEGSPQSLQKFASGTAVALNDKEVEALNKMLADSGLATELKAINAALLDAVREIAPQAIVWSAPRVHYAAIGELPLSLPAFTGFGQQTLNLSGLDRIQRTVLLFKIAANIRAVNTFTQGALRSDVLLSEEKISTALDAVEQALGFDIFKKGSGAMKRVLTLPQALSFVKNAGKLFKAYSAIKLTTQWLGALSQLASYLVPDSVSAFYAQAGSARTATTYNIRKDDVISLSMYIVPQMSGGSVATPSGLANMVIDSVKAPFLDRIAGTAVVKKFEQGAKLWMTQLAFTALDKMMGSIASGNQAATREWATSQQNTYTLPQKNLAPIEINDRRVVNLRVSPANAPQVLLDQRDSRFTITGKTAGNVSVIGYIHNIELLRYVASNSNFSMSVTVVEDKPAPTPLPQPKTDPTPPNNNKGFPIRLPPGPPRPLTPNEIATTGMLDCVNEIQVALVPLPNPWIDPRIIGTNCAPK